MNKTIKRVFIAGVISAMCAGAVFARGGKNSGNPQAPNFQNFNNCAMQNGNGGFDGRFNGNNGKHMGGMMGACDEIVVGKIKSVDEANGKVTVTNVDNKAVEIAVTGFTGICDTNRNELKLSDLKAGSEILVKICKTDTTTKVAGRVFVKVN